MDDRKKPLREKRGSKSVWSKKPFGVRWKQSGFPTVTTSKHISYKTLAEAEDYCRRVNAKYREITQWPVRMSETGKVVEEYPVP